MNLSLVILTEADAEKVSKLRVAAYRRQYGERADSAKLHWNSNDRRYLNIGVVRKNDGELLSTLRIAFLRVPGDFEKVVLMKHDPVRFDLPLSVLGRGATHEDFEGQGLHGLLRRAALEISKDAGALSIVGTMEIGSLRIRQMTEIGYTFSENPEPWNGFLINDKPVVIGILPAGEKLDRAIEILSAHEAKRGRGVEDLIDYAAAAKKLRDAIPVNV